MRLAGRYSDIDGWLTNVTTGNEVPIDKDLGLRASALYEMSDSTDVHLMYQHTRNQRFGSPAQIVDPGLSALGIDIGPDLGESSFDRTKAAFSSDPRLRDGEDFHDLEADLVNLTFNIGVGDAVLTSVSSYATFDASINDDFDFDNKDFTPFIYNEDYEQYAQELRIASPPEKAFSYIAGVFYFHSQWNQIFEHNWAITGFSSARRSSGTRARRYFQWPYTHDFRQETQTLAAFAQGTWRLGDRSRVNIGLRVTDEAKDVLYGRFALAPFTLWNTVIQAPFPTQALAHDSSFVTGSASFQYDLNEEVMLYVSAARGGKSGGFGEFNTVPFDPSVGRGNPAVDAFVDDERTNAYEVGAKSRLSNRAVLNASLFWTDVFDLQQLSFTPAGTFVSTNDRAQSKGLEASLTWQMSDAFRVEHRLHVCRYGRQEQGDAADPLAGVVRQPGVDV